MGDCPVPTAANGCAACPTAGQGVGRAGGPGGGGGGAGAAGSVGLQFGGHHPHAGNPHLPAASEDRERCRQSRNIGDGSRRLQAGTLIPSGRDWYGSLLSESEVHPLRRLMPGRTSASTAPAIDKCCAILIQKLSYGFLEDVRFLGRLAAENEENFGTTALARSPVLHVDRR